MNPRRRHTKKKSENTVNLLKADIIGANKSVRFIEIPL